MRVAFDTNRYVDLRKGVPETVEIATTHRFGALYRQLRTQGTPIPTHDVWVAALAVEHDLLLHSRDAHFDRLPQILRI